jgi:hypothetical protein
MQPLIQLLSHSPRCSRDDLLYLPVLLRLGAGAPSHSGFTFVISVGLNTQERKFTELKSGERGGQELGIHLLNHIFLNLECSGCLTALPKCGNVPHF